LVNSDPYASNFNLHEGPTHYQKFSYSEQFHNENGTTPQNVETAEMSIRQKILGWQKWSAMEKADDWNPDQIAGLLP
jgi:hypothetical protein